MLVWLKKKEHYKTYIKVENYEFKTYKFLKAYIKVKNYKFKNYRFFESIYKNGKSYNVWRYWNSQTNISPT